MPSRTDSIAGPLGRNRLLDMLPSRERERLVERTRSIPITPHDMLHAPGERIRFVYFPLRGVVSLMTPLESGEAIEIATVGNEGMVGLHAWFAAGPLANVQAMSQVPGEALRMDADHFRAEVEGGGGKLRPVMFAYTQALFAQISQGVACNAAHPIQARCARWLLETHDRAGSDNFQLTQEFLSDMLGVRRPSVTVAERTLQNAGIIRYRRGDITVLDRTGLEEAACECYRAVKEAYQRLLVS
ncbi:MAG TPA: Crp/Fnr family transcriptional regulator [Actinomycetota bacterium]|nr:Crp/Fnr family transcriptional regulator [Actinomycetota bacterium]